MKTKSALDDGWSMKEGFEGGRDDNLAGAQEGLLELTALCTLSRVRVKCGNVLRLVSGQVLNVQVVS